MNIIRVTVLMAVLTAILVFFGQIIGGKVGALYALILAGIMNFIGYWFSDKIVLAMYRAKEVKFHEAPEIYSVVQRLTMKANMPMPKVYIIPQDTPNAFATGRNPKHAAVALTQGISTLLTEDELEGVLSHELTHVQNRDILIGSIAATIAGAITYLANMARWAMIFGGRDSREERNGSAIGLLVMTIVAPIAALLIQMAISRSREYLADEGGAKISGKPLALASALQKIQAKIRYRPMMANPSTAHMFIVNPLGTDFWATLFSTHPLVKDRVKRLESIALKPLTK